MMQAMAEFVEQGYHFIMGEQRGLSAERSREIAVEISHRRLQAGAFAPAGNRIVHPCSTALRGPGVQIQIKLAHQRAVAVSDGEKTHVLVPCRRLVRDDVQSVESFD